MCETNEMDVSYSWLLASDWLLVLLLLLLEWPPNTVIVPQSYILDPDFIALF